MRPGRLREACHAAHLLHTTAALDGPEAQPVARSDAQSNFLALVLVVPFVFDMAKPVSMLKTSFALLHETIVLRLQCHQDISGRPGPTGLKPQIKNNPKEMQMPKITQKEMHGWRSTIMPRMTRPEDKTKVPHEALNSSDLADGWQLLEHAHAPPCHKFIAGHRFFG